MYVINCVCVYVYVCMYVCASLQRPMSKQWRHTVARKPMYDCFIYLMLWRHLVNIIPSISPVQ